MGIFQKSRLKKIFPEDGGRNTKHGWQLNVSDTSGLIKDDLGNLKSLKVDGKAWDLATMAYHRGGDAQQQKYSALIHIGSPLPVGIHLFEFEFEGEAKFSLQREIRPVARPAPKPATSD